MSTKLRLSLAAAGLALSSGVALWCGAPARAEDKPAAAADRPFTDTFPEDVKDFSSTGRNTFFVLEPGYVEVFAGTEKGKKVELTITVLGETRTLAGVETRVVEERETADGHLGEVSRNFFAISKRTGNVYYFGEEMIEDGKVAAGAKGAWLAGEKGARYGLYMPAVPLLGARYQEEVAPGDSMDRSEVTSLSDTLETPAGKFQNVLTVAETTPLEPDESESKRFAPGVGLIEDDGMKLVRYGAGK